MNSIALILTLLTFSTTLHASPATVLNKGLDFFEWLEHHMDTFATCEPTEAGGAIKLCDGTTLQKNELKDLFQMPPGNLVKYIEARGVKVQILCDSKSTAAAPFKENCKTGLNQKMFEKITPLHGQYLPNEHTALLRSTASPGSLIHEYLHHRQFTNRIPVHGKIYKKERIEVQNALVKVMDESIAKVKAAENAKDKALVKSHLDNFMAASEMVRKFALWQDLIDERGLFQLYIKYGQKLGAAAEDIALAKKNMGFICDNPKLKPVLPASNCAQTP